MNVAAFDATKEFDSALEEIETLIRQAKSAESQSDGYAVYIKAAIVLLAAKLEAFAENIAEEYIRALSTLQLQARDLPDVVKITSTTFLLSSCFFESGFKKKPETLSKLKSAADLWRDDVVLDKLFVDTKFNYGKHGSTELVGIFKRLGIEDICQECLINSSENTNFLAEDTRENIASTVDSLTKIRNNVIHSDAKLADFTYQDVEKYSNKLREFCFLVDAKLASVRQQYENKKN